VLLFSHNLHRIQAISLGQGQGPVAEKMIASAAQTGDWIFLQVNYFICCFVGCNEAQTDFQLWPHGFNAVYIILSKAK
jgi:Dynein heavy chain region D6 P-loop domain